MRGFGLLLAFLALCGIAQAETVQPDTAHPVGLTMLTVKDPASGGPVRSLILYPSQSAGEPTRMGPFVLDASRDMPAAKGHFPLILLSHGNEGSYLSHRDSAMALAQAGYIVATPMHAGDNFQDRRLLGTEVLLSSRPKSISALIDALLADGRLPIDPKKIGFIGFSAGGYTGLALLGARPSYARAALHCEDHPQDPICQYAPVDPGKPVLITDLSDNRIKAAVLMDPLTWNFTDDELAAVKTPVYLMRPEQGDVLAEAFHSDRIAKVSPGVETVWSIKHAGHFSFLAPFPEAIKADVGPIAQDAPGFDREAVHEEINRRMIDFFGRVLTPRS